MYKLIVSDLDETLLREDGTISAANVAAIKAARDRGVKFVPNTGRSFTSVQDLLHTLGLAGRDDQYVIAYNGGATVSNDHNRVVAVNPMAYDVARRIFAITKTFPETDTHVYTLNEVFLYKPRADDIQYMQTRGAAYTVMPDDDFSRFQNLQIMKVIAMNPDPAVQKAIADQVMSALDQRLNLTFSSGIYTEFNRWEWTKVLRHCSWARRSASNVTKSLASVIISTTWHCYSKWGCRWRLPMAGPKLRPPQS